MIQILFSFFLQDILSECPATDTLIVSDETSFNYSECNSFNAVVFTEDVRIIPNYSFARCQKLETVTFGSNIQSIGNYTFLDCVQLRVISALPSTLTILNSYAFSRCILLQNIDFSQATKLTTLSANLFYHSPLLSSIQFPPQLETIEQRAFSGTGFTELVFPDTVKTIGEACYADCSSLTSITFGKNVEVIPTQFYGSNNIKTISVSSDNLNLTVNDNVLFSKDGTTLLMYAPAQEKTQYTIPSGTTKLGAYCFSNSIYLTHVNLKDIVEFGKAIFKESKSIFSCTLPNTTTVIPESLFDGAPSFQIFSFPSSVTTIEDSAFASTSLKTLNFPSTLTFLGKYSFYHCFNLTEIHFTGENSITLSDSAFLDCLSLETIDFGTCTINLIGPKCFCYCYSLKSFDFRGDNIKVINDNSFKDCYKLTTFTFEDSLETIGESAFENCYSLIGLDLSRTNISLIQKSAFSGCESFAEILLPKSLITLEEAVFENCSSIKELNFPDSVVSIGEYCYSGCSQLTSIYFGKNAQNISSSPYNTIGLTNISLHEENEYYIVVDNVLLTKDSQKLLIYPPSHIPSNTLNDVYIYTTSSDTTEIAEYAFACCKYITKLVLTNVNKLSRGAFERSSIEEIEINEAGLTSIPDYAFYSSQLLASVTIPSTVISIGVSAFSYTSIVSMTLPQGLQSIGDEAFSFCKSLRTINIPIGVPEIPIYCFHSDDELTNVTFDSLEEHTIEYIKYSAFIWCTSLKTITFPNSLKHILGLAFFQSGLETLDLAQVTTVLSECFSSCSHLGTVTSLGNIKSIPFMCFYKNSALTQIDLSNIISINSQAFAGCTSLSSVIWGESIQTIGSQSFMNTNIENIEISITTDQIEDDTFSGCFNVKSIYVHPNNGAFKSDSANISLLSRDETYLYFICGNYQTHYTFQSHTTDYSSAAFAYHKYLTGVTFPDSIRVIKENTFCQCVSLKYVDLTNIEQIGANSFSGSGIKSVTISTAMNNISEMAFSACIQLETVTFSSPSKLTTICSRAFSECPILTITLPDSVTTIEDRVFYGCSSLTSIVFPNNLEIIPENVCNFCSELRTVVFGSQTASIGANSFANCAKLTQIEIPNSVHCIYGQAFLSCTSLSNISFGNGLNEIYFSAFQQCTRLVHIVLPESLFIIQHNVFAGCTALETVLFNDDLETIQMNAFLGCVNLGPTIHLPLRLKQVGMYAFSQTSISAFEIDQSATDFTVSDGVLYDKTMTKLVLYPYNKGSEYETPWSVVEICGYAFQGTQQLKRLRLHDISTWGYEAFLDISNLTVELPDGIEPPAGYFDPEVTIIYYTPGPAPTSTTSPTTTSSSTSITETSEITSITTTGTSQTTSKKGLGKVALISIIVGCSLILIIITLIVALIVNIRIKRKLLEKTQTGLSLQLDTTFI